MLTWHNFKFKSNIGSPFDRLFKLTPVIFLRIDSSHHYWLKSYILGNIISVKIHVFLGALIDGGKEVGVYEGGGERNINLFYKQGTFPSCLKQIRHIHCLKSLFRMLC